MKNPFRPSWLAGWLHTSQSAKQQVIFITSETRSGSTWLSYVLGTHPNAAHLGEYYRPFIHSGHITCRLCQGRGLDDCEVLGNLNNVSIPNAYTYALDRHKPLGVNTLIDCSKDLGWLEQILMARSDINHNDISIKIIHLIRDPRGWIASERRRVPMQTKDAIDRWKRHYYNTYQWIQESKLPSICISYDQLCLEPERSLRKLSRLIGAQQSVLQYQYWQKEHHGLGGNGAALNNLINSPKANPNTGDDPFYKQQLNKVFYDLRWRSEEDAKQIDAQCNQSDVQLIFKSCGISMHRIDQLSRQISSIKFS